MTGLPDQRNNILVLQTNNQQAFTSTTGIQTSAGAVQTAHCVFNPVGSGLFFYVYSIKIATASGAMHHLNGVTTNPSYANAATPVNNLIGSAVTSVSSCTFLNAAAANAGEQICATGTGGNTITEILQNGMVYILQPGSGLTMFLTTSTNNWQSTMCWIEGV